MTRQNDSLPDARPDPAGNSARPDDTMIITALSTLTARVAVLERWMRRSRRREALMMMAIAVALLAGLVLAVLR